MNGFLITTEGDQLPINLNDLGEDFKSANKTLCGVAKIFAGAIVTDKIILYDHLGFTKNLRLNHVCTILADKEIRGHAIIVIEKDFDKWIKQ